MFALPLPQRAAQALRLDVRLRLLVLSHRFGEAPLVLAHVHYNGRFEFWRVSRAGSSCFSQNLCPAFWGDIPSRRARQGGLPPPVLGAVM